MSRAGIHAVLTGQQPLPRIHFPSPLPENVLIARAAEGQVSGLKGAKKRTSNARETTELAPLLIFFRDTYSANTRNVYRPGLVHTAEILCYAFNAGI